MSEQDMRDLWDAVDGLRDQQHIANTMLAEIKAVLSERCEGRSRRIGELEDGLERLKARVWWFAGASSTIAFLFSKLWPWAVSK